MRNLDQYIEKAKKIHNNFYDYSKTNPKTCKDKCIITCPIHGDFWTTLDNHVNGKTGCPECKGVKKLTTEDFIKKAREIHENKYDYSKTIYKNAKEKVCIICPRHGEFWQEARHHLNGAGCPKCKGVKKLTTEEFIERAKKIHNDFYDYSKTIYKNAKEKVCIICPEHGEFWQEASSHLQGCKCPKCVGGITLTTEEFIEKAKKVHNDFYDYSKTIYKNAKEKVCIICPRHGEFWQEASSHLQGKGCPKCKSSKLENILIKFLNKNEIFYIFQYKIKELGKKTLDFFLPYYNTVIECQGEQHYVPSMFSKKIDPMKKFMERISIDAEKYKCCRDNNINVIYFTIPSYFSNSDINVNDGFYKDKIVITHIDDLSRKLNEIKQNIKQTNFSLFCKDILTINKNIIIENNIIKYKNFAISFDEIKPNQKDSLNNKRRYYKKQNIKLINIFEDEYVYKHDIVISKLIHCLSINKDAFKKIPGRKCDINLITKNDAKDFLEKYHIQGFSPSSVYIGCFYENSLIAVMTFKKEKNNSWELNRFASDYNYICQGIGGKLLKYFIKAYNPKIIKSFADKRWTVNKDDNLYTKLGFSLEKSLAPNYKYHGVNESNYIRHHKFNFRKNILHKKYNLPLTMTETQMANSLGYYKIWDCGLYKYIWENK